MSLHSEISLALPEQPCEAGPVIELRTGTREWFAERVKNAELQNTDGSWYQNTRLSDASSYARWEGVGEFLVSGNGRRIVCRQSSDASVESFHVYLLGRALSFALVQQGFEPFHATAVVIDGGAVAFMGDSGFGKSSLAAYFLAEGHRILTDDLLVMRDTPQGVLAYPGPARIKLFPLMARKFLGQSSHGIQMNSSTKKLILPINLSQVCETPIPLTAIYSLVSPRTVFRGQAIDISSLSPREAFFELIKNTFNYQILDPHRLKRHFAHAEHLIGRVRIQRLAYPRRLARLPALRKAILTDLSLKSEAETCGS